MGRVKPCRGVGRTIAASRLIAADLGAVRIQYRFERRVRELDADPAVTLDWQDVLRDIEGKVWSPKSAD